MHSFDEISRGIRENGGKIVALDDPKLTHVVLDKRDDSRRLILMHRTSEQVFLHVVVVQLSCIF
jgi:DNA ligase-4